MNRVVRRLLGSVALTRGTRALYRVPGYSSLVRAARRRVVGRAGGIAQTRSGYPVWVDEQTYDFVVPYLREEYEPDLSRLLTGLLAAGDVFVDVGANAGHFSLLAAPIVGGSGEVWALEPDPLAFHALDRNVAAGGHRNVRCLNVAVAAREGTVTLFRSGFGGGMNSLISSPESAGRDPVEVRAAPLESLLDGRPVRGIKIDVEGAEQEVLAGARRLVAPGSDTWVIVEWRPWFLEEWGGGDAAAPLRTLRELGLSVYVIEEEALGLSEISETGAEFAREANYNLLAVRAGGSAELTALELAPLRR